MQKGAECVSGPKKCPCFLDGECEMTQANFLNVIHSINDATSCHGLCVFYNGIQANSKCTHFTFHKVKFPGVCLLFNGCTSKVKCDGCIFGPSECSFCTWEEKKEGTCPSGIFARNGEGKIKLSVVLCYSADISKPKPKH